MAHSPPSSRMMAAPPVARYLSYYIISDIKVLEMAHSPRYLSFYSYVISDIRVLEMAHSPRYLSFYSYVINDIKVLEMAHSPPSSRVLVLLLLCYQRHSSLRDGPLTSQQQDDCSAPGGQVLVLTVGHGDLAHR